MKKLYREQKKKELVKNSKLLQKNRQWKTIDEIISLINYT